VGGGLCGCATTRVTHRKLRARRPSFYERGSDPAGACRTESAQS
jgi:hypothetical protein